MADSIPQTDKGKLNYDTIRRLHMKKVQQINNLYIESQLTVDALSLELKVIEEKAKASKGRFHVSVPSMRGKDQEISRKYDDVIAMIKGRIKYKEFVQSLVFAISLTESYISEIMCLNLVAFPAKLLISIKGNEAVSYQVEMREILNSRSIEEIVSNKAEQRVRDALFASPRAYMKYLETVMSFAIPENLMKQFAEIKATRDVYVHDDGKVNETYLSKSEEAARATLGSKLIVDAQYLSASVSCMKDIFSAILKGMLVKHGESVEMQRALTARLI